MSSYANQFFNIGLLFLSFATAFIGSYLAICLLEQLRSAYIHNGHQNNMSLMKWFVMIGISLCGIGIWSMHFVGMSAMTLSDHHERIPVSFNIAISIISIIVVVFTTAVGAYISSNYLLNPKQKF